MQVPMFAPIISGSAERKLITPSCAIAMMIAVVALELCMIPVNKALAIMPSAGVLPNSARRLRRYSDSLRGAKPCFIVSIPRNKSPKPIKICPAYPLWRFLRKWMKTPSAIIGRENFPIGNDTICAVTVVPISAPKIIPMDCASVMIPELTRETTVTVVMLEL